jgi:hypothetical protein
MIGYTIEWIWHVVLGMTVVFYLAAYVAPRAMSGLQSMPWAFHVEKNLDLDLQSVLYATHHARGLSRFTHLTIPIEQVAWFVVLAFVHPAAISVAIVLLGAQAFLCRELQLAMIVMMAWAVVAGAALWGIYLLGLEGAYGYAVVLLLGCALFRVVGRLVEPLPPTIVERSDRFVPMARLLGLVSEFASGLPFRLFIVQVSWLAQALGYRPWRVMPWAQARRIAAEIHTSGWRAYTPVTELMAPHFVLELAVAQAAPQPALARSWKRRS